MTPLPACFAVHRGWWPACVVAIQGIVPWEQPTLRICGRQLEAPRMTAWFGPASYSYSGYTHAAREMPTWLYALASRLRLETGERFDSVLLNLYRDGSDSVGWHADDEPELGPDPTIASLSLGAPRRFAIRPRELGRRSGYTPPDAGWTLELGDGDLLVMSGESQRAYLHSVPKTTREVGPRINLSFRRMVRS